MQSFSFCATKSVRFGRGLTANFPQAIADLVGPRVLLVTDAGIRRLGLCDPLIKCLEKYDIHCSVFDGTLPEPPEQNVLDAVNAGQHIKATGVIGFGGGSAMDVAKVAALLLGSGTPLEQVYGVQVAAGPRLPLVLVPTTAGTGSEATPVAILVSGDKKKGMVSDYLVPDVALLDPDLTLGLPPSITAATGMDAMVHAIEAYTSASSNRNPISMGLARHALRLLGGNLRKVIQDGRDPDSRGAMLLGSFMAGQAFANSPVGAVHALAYPLGGRFHATHGVSTALLLQHVMRFNLPVAAVDYGVIAVDIFPELVHAPEDARADMMIGKLLELETAIGLPTSLHALGVTDADVPALAEEAMLQTRLLPNNPRAVGKDDAIQIYKALLR